MRKFLGIVSLAALVGGSLVGPRPTTAAEPAAFPGANGDIVFVSEEPGKPVIARMDQNGNGIHMLTQSGQSSTVFGDQNPRWSPGGKFIVFTRYYTGGNGDIWMMNADGTGQKRLTTTGTDDDWPSFSADGARIVFSSNRHGDYEIYSMLLTGAGVTRLTTNAAVDWLPAWSPNNNRIAFSSDRRGVYETFTMNVDGSGVVRETTGTAEGDIDQVWSADGQYIYYTRLADNGFGDIWKVNVATDATTQVRGLLQDEFQPAAVPNPAGSVWDLAYVAIESDQFVVAVGDESGFGYLTLAYPHNAYMPDWQPVPVFPLVDAKFSPFKTDIEWVFAEGITVGCSPERYCPTDPVTREQMATFLVRALGLTGTPPDAFTDDNGSTHELNINRLAAAGITSGCAPNLFCPTAPVARDQMASFLSRALGLTGTPPDAFTDDNGNTHELNINRLFAAGITSGCGGTNYCPTQTVTRGQMAAFLHRAFD